MGKKKAAAKSGVAADSATDSATTSTTPLAPKTFQVFERANIMRSQLRFHETNPMVMDQHAAKRLRQGVKDFGLVTALTVNRRETANGFPASKQGQLVLVGGHQRCRSMDSLAGFNQETGENDYQIPIDIITVDPAKELEILVFLNNRNAQGNYDLDLLAEIVTTPGVKVGSLGFDKVELYNMLDAGIVDELFGVKNPQTTAEAPVIAAIAEIAADSKAFQKQAEAAAANNAAPPTVLQPPTGQVSPGLTENSPQPTPQAPAKPDINSVEAIKGRRFDFRDKTSDAGVESHYTLIANSPDELAALLLNLGLPPEQAFCDLAAFIDRLSSVAGMELGDLLGGEVADASEESTPAGQGSDLQESELAE